MKKYAFTLAEMFVVMSVLAIVASVTIPSIATNKVSKNKMLFKKAFKEVEIVVTDLLNDERVYPEIWGFAYTTSKKIDGTAYSGNSKFCSLFANRVNLLSAINCTGASGGNPSFTSSDGVSWNIGQWLPSRKMTNGVWVNREVNNPTTIITIDANGWNRPPNCRATTYDKTRKKVTDAACKNPDRFQIQVRWDGKILPNGDVERGYLLDNSQ